MLIPFVIPFIIAVFLAVNMGGSGTGPAFSAAYGTKMLNRSLIPGLFGLAVFAGAIIGGEKTALTVGRELASPDILTFWVASIVLFSVAISLLIANISGIPQSTSQSTVCALIAPAIYFGCLDSEKLLHQILPVWVLLPLLAFSLSYLAGRFIYRPLRQKGYTISKQLNSNFLMKGTVVAMSLYSAFAIGTNNVANAAGILASMASNELSIAPEHFIHVLIIATMIVAPSFAIGSSLFSHKLVRNTGKEIMLLGRIEFIIIAFISASLLLGASLIYGVPSSLVQLNVAAIVGIGVSKLGARNIFKKTEVNSFFAIWVVAPFIAFLLSLMLTYSAHQMGFLG
jgi:sulfate permease